jgi:hypothetical protein
MSLVPERVLCKVISAGLAMCCATHAAGTPAADIPRLPCTCPPCGITLPGRKEYLLHQYTRGHRNRVQQLIKATQSKLAVWRAGVVLAWGGI